VIGRQSRYRSRIFPAAMDFGLGAGHN